MRFVRLGLLIVAVLLVAGGGWFVRGRWDSAATPSAIEVAAEIAKVFSVSYEVGDYDPLSPQDVLSFFAKTWWLKVADQKLRINEWELVLTTRLGKADVGHELASFELAGPGGVTHFSVVARPVGHLARLRRWLS